MAQQTKYIDEYVAGLTARTDLDGTEEVLLNVQGENTKTTLANVKAYAADETQAAKIANLEKYGIIGVLSSWNNIAKLTTASTEAEILAALYVTPISGTKTTTKSALYAILDQCAINGKWLRESSTNAKVSVEFIGSCYVIQIVGSKAALSDGSIIGVPALRNITISASDTLKVLRAPKEIKFDTIDEVSSHIINPKYWKKLVGDNGDYNSVTGYYELNGLTDITDDEAATIVADCSGLLYWGTHMIRAFSGSKMRTNIPPRNVTYSDIEAAYIFSNCENLEVVNLNEGFCFGGSFYSLFEGCKKLREVIGTIDIISKEDQDSPFEGCENLQKVYLTSWDGRSLNFSSCKKLHYDTLKYLQTQASLSNDKNKQITLSAETIDYLSGVKQPTEEVGGTQEEWLALKLWFDKSGVTIYKAS